MNTKEEIRIASNLSEKRQKEEWERFHATQLQKPREANIIE